MRLDFALFHPDPDESAKIQALLEFWQSRQGQPFRRDEAAFGAEWLRDDYSMVALGDALFVQSAGRWTAEPMIPGTAHHYALRVLDDVEALCGGKEVPSTDREFIGLVYRRREELLGRTPPGGILSKDGSGLPAGGEDLFDFVQERLGRCGFHSFRADLGSIAELWDIFDDYEFQKLMGRRP